MGRTEQVSDDVVDVGDDAKRLTQGENAAAVKRFEEAADAAATAYFDLEPVEPLDGPEPLGFDGYYTEEDGRTLPLGSVVIGYFDSPDYIGKKVDWWENPVDLLDSQGLHVGYASLYIEDSKLRADLFIAYASPDRLTIEAKSYPLYAYPIAAVGTERVWIYAVKLDAGKPTDERIVAL